MESWDDLFSTAASALEAGDAEAAAELLDSLKEHEPSSQRTIVLESRLLETTGRLDEARALLEGWIARSPDNATARVNLARLQLRTGDRTRAISTLRFGLMQQPNQDRALHLYAALIEHDSGLATALQSLRLLSGVAGAWRPAWVGAEVAAARGAPDDVAPLLVLAAERSLEPFPPNRDGFDRLLEAIPISQRRVCLSSLRPFCRSEAQSLIDERLAALQPRASSSLLLRASCLRRSVWRHLASPRERSSVGLAPICLIKPEAWGATEIAGRLSRGFALLLAETMDALAESDPAVIVESVAGAGLLYRDTPQPGDALANRAGATCERLVTSYLSFKAPDEFILDAEIYLADGAYLARASSRGGTPGACLEEMARKLVGALPAESIDAPRPPAPSLEIEDALARESVASLVLCGEGALEVATLVNPGLLLDRLVQYAVSAEEASALLTLWAGIEAAWRAGLPGGDAQRGAMADVLAGNEALAYWTRG